mgnify:CR=1 FL=1|jgi:hypothetical protein
MTSQRPSSRTLAAGVGGVVHAAVAGLLWTQFGFENLLTLLGSETLYATYALGGMVLTGVIPVALSQWRGTATPLLFVAGAFVLAALGTWTTVRQGLTPVGPTPFGWYVLLWPAVVAVAGTVGEIELRARRYRLA